MKKIRNDYCLLMYTGNDDNRPAMKKIHGENGFVYATEGHIAVKIDHSKCEKIYSKIDSYPSIEKIFNDHKSSDIKYFYVDDLFECIMKIELCFKPEQIVCDKCFGDGYLICDHCDSEYDCGRCHGIGSINGEKLILSGDKNIEFFNRQYNLEHFNKIISTALFVGSNRISISNGDKSGSGSIFKVGEFEILLMPVYTGN